MSQAQFARTPDPSSSRKLVEEIVFWGKLVKFSHTIFALPFALSMLFVVGERYPVSMLQVVWIVVALVAARTAAMSFNRILDRKIDAQNPRTVDRELPRGAVSLHSVIALCVISSGMFFVAAGLLGVHCLVLAPLVLAILLFYSYTKRFTRYAHFVLGLTLSLAPGGVWYAISGEVAFLPIPLMLGIIFWVSGFDIIYSCQDAEFDKREGLFSIPATIGLSRALSLARILHVGAIISFGWFGFLANTGPIFWVGLGVFASILASQHRLVSPTSLDRADAAFFTRNGLASVIFLLGVGLDVLF